MTFSRLKESIKCRHDWRAAACRAVFQWWVKEKKLSESWTLGGEERAKKFFWEGRGIFQLEGWREV